jgi:hypothetical protein
LERFGGGGEAVEVEVDVCAVSVLRVLARVFRVKIACEHSKPDTRPRRPSRVKMPSFVEKPYKTIAWVGRC